MVAPLTLTLCIKVKLNDLLCHEQAVRRIHPLKKIACVFTIFLQLFFLCRNNNMIYGLPSSCDLTPVVWTLQGWLPYSEYLQVTLCNDVRRCGGVCVWHDGCRDWLLMKKRKEKESASFVECNNPCLHLQGFSMNDVVIPWSMSWACLYDIVVLHRCIKLIKNEYKGNTLGSE